MVKVQFLFPWDRLTHSEILKNPAEANLVLAVKWGMRNHYKNMPIQIY